MQTNFVLFAEARTGSYSLASRLASCPDVICHGEAFKRDRIEIPPFHQKRMSRPTLTLRNHDPMGFITALRAVNPNKIFGFKYFYHHLLWSPAVIDYLKAPTTRRVVLLRDPIEMYASALRARHTGVWTLRGKTALSEEVLNKPVVHTREALQAFAAKYNGYILFAHLLSALRPSHVIRYDQINDPEAINALFQFLGSTADPAKSESEYKKQFTGTLAEGFENWTELQQDLAERYLFAAPPPPSFGM